jgi:hypothetical protein
MQETILANGILSQRKPKSLLDITHTGIALEISDNVASNSRGILLLPESFTLLVEHNVPS